MIPRPGPSRLSFTRPAAVWLYHSAKGGSRQTSKAWAVCLSVTSLGLTKQGWGLLGAVKLHLLVPLNFHWFNWVAESLVGSITFLWGIYNAQPLAWSSFLWRPEDGKVCWEFIARRHFEVDVWGWKAPFGHVKVLGHICLLKWFYFCVSMRQTVLSSPFS